MVDDLESALDNAGLDVEHGDAPTILAIPGRLIGGMAGPGVKALVPDKLVQLTNRNLEIQLYPSDIAIAGQEMLVTRSRAAIASRLASTSAFLTTTAEAEGIEARLERLARSGQGGRRAAAELASIDHDLATVKVPYEEWETLYRIRLQVERDLLAGQRPGETAPGGTAPAGTGATPLARPPESEPASPLQVALATLSIGLVAIDVALAIRERFSRR
jgi:hypothetical protein